MLNSAKTRTQNLAIKIRTLKDHAARYVITLGGICVILSIVLIVGYFLSVVAPFFQSASVTSKKISSTPENYLYFVADEYLETRSFVSKNGQVVHASFDNNKRKNQNFSLLDITQFTRFSNTPPSYAWGLESGEVALIQHEFKLNYTDNKRTVTPNVTPAFSEDLELLEVSASPIEKIAARDAEGEFLIAFKNESGLFLARFNKTESLGGEGTVLEEESIEPLQTDGEAFSNKAIDDYNLHISNDGRWLLAIARDGRIAAYPLFNDESKPIITNHGTEITVSEWLLGEVSILIGDVDGYITRMFLVNDQWQQIHKTKLGDEPIRALASEQQRKVFAALDSVGRIGIYYAPTNTPILQQSVDPQFTQLKFSPRGDALLVSDAKTTLVFNLDNEYPEVNWKSLWQKVHYEGYKKPEYVWQSSAANQDFEPKFSLTPLTFGTLKAAFYAMLIAMPLALMGAIYTAFFMSSGMRQAVKPTIEVMEALPTVILGFLAGLWLSPFIENNLGEIFSTLYLVPIAVLIFGWIWSKAPHNWQNRFGVERRVILVIPVIIVTTWIAFQIATPIENIFFNGDLRFYISQDLGITYDQRNALIVGIAMGFAVIPTIFSIAEDAIFSVPKHLVNGSLALGASPWQTLTGVVIPTASPGIFSGVMIGFGRAVGETMIVLMATGNTPIMDFNIFEGMRTLAANLAVEMPESEHGSSHYRILFLAAIVLFAFTFVFNTGAEIIRQRLRKKYGSL